MGEEWFKGREEVGWGMGGMVEGEILVELNEGKIYFQLKKKKEKLLVLLQGPPPPQLLPVFSYFNQRCHLLLSIG